VAVAHVEQAGVHQQQPGRVGADVGEPGRGDGDDQLAVGPRGSLEPPALLDATRGALHGLDHARAHQGRQLRRGLGGDQVDIEGRVAPPRRGGVELDPRPRRAR
jgi:hypothetical protein